MRLLNIALLSTVLLLVGTTLPAMAGTAGVTAAVNPEARGTPPGGAVRTIVLGDNILTDEKIDTGPGGLVQVLLADGTTFTVGPNSSLTIDKFVYDPNANTAQVTASLARGVFRFIGGRTSKTEGGVEINTPVGTVGIRGAVADISLTPNGQELKAQIDLLFGKEVTLTGPGGLLERIYKAGYSIIIGQDGRPKLVKTPPGAAGGIQQALAGKPGTHGGTGNPPTDDQVGNSGVPGDNSDKTPHDNAPPDFTPPDLDAILLATIDFFDSHDNAKDILGTDNPGGFGAGYVTISSDGPSGTLAVGNSDPADVLIGFGPNSARLTGTIPYSESELPFEIALGFDDPQTASVTVDGYPQDALTVANAVHPQVSSLLCEACDFIKWGTWDSTFESGDYSASAVGTYITGDITTEAQYRTRSGSATYYGTAQGYASDADNGGDLHPAAGDLNLSWNFDHRSGSITISGFDKHDNFDGFDLTAPLSAASGSPGFSGLAPIGGDYDDDEDPDNGSFAVDGAFVNHGSTFAAGVVGNFSVGLDNGEYSATGIFGGSDTPPPNTH